MVAGKLPFVVDVDSGAARTIEVPGLQAGIGTWVRRVGRDAVLVARSVCVDCLNGEAFLLRRGASVASSVGGALDIAPARSGDAIWLLRSEAVGQCTIRQIGSEGGVRIPPRAAECGTVRGQSPPGIVLTPVNGSGEILLDPVSGRVLLRARVILGATGRLALTAARSRAFTLHDLRSDSRRTLRWPSRLPELGYGVPQARGRLIAIAFTNPPPAQYFDVWVFDPASRRFSQMPGRLANDAFKFTTISWSDDGRLVLLTRINGRAALAVWRPGARRITSGYLRLPAPNIGAAGMVTW